MLLEKRSNVPTCQPQRANARLAPLNLRGFFNVPTVFFINKKSNILIKVSSGIENIGEEGYLISILPKQYLTIEANSKKGVYYGVQTLKQILLYTKEKRDNPNFVSFEKNEKIVEENYPTLQMKFIKPLLPGIIISRIIRSNFIIFIFS